MASSALGGAQESRSLGPKPTLGALPRRPLRLPIWSTVLHFRGTPTSTGMLGSGLGPVAPGGALNRGKSSQAEALVNGRSSFLYPLSRQKLTVQQEGQFRNNFFRARLGCLAKEAQEIRGSASAPFPYIYPPRPGNSRELVKPRSRKSFSVWAPGGC